MVKGVGVFFATKFFFIESQGLPGTRLNTWKYSICGIKLETKVISLHKIEVLKISSFPLNKYAVHNI